MSTFKGLLVDRPLQFIAIDHFGPHTYGCDVFLLSHHHSDHMDGLFTENFANLINQSEDKFIYCSTVTAHFLSKNYRNHIGRDKIRPLDIYKSFVVVHKHLKSDVVITCLSAGHCPGSVMFLIEYQGKRILYSGDIRITADDLKKIRGGLTNADSSVIEIDDLYLDTTWAVPSKFDVIPSREDSQNVILELVEKFISSNYKVALNPPSNFGYETLYMSLYRKLRKPVVMHDNNFEYYRNVEEMSGCVTSFNHCTPEDWVVHACPRHTCPIQADENIRIIRPCAYGFVKNHFPNFQIDDKYQVPIYKSANVIRVMYSCHNSLSELREIYEVLRPKIIYPSVRAPENTTQNIVSLLKSSNTNENSKIQLGLNVKPSNPQQCREEAERRRLNARKKFNL